MLYPLSYRGRCCRFLKVCDLGGLPDSYPAYSLGNSLHGPSGGFRRSTQVYHVSRYGRTRWAQAAKRPWYAVPFEGTCVAGGAIERCEDQRRAAPERGWWRWCLPLWAGTRADDYGTDDYGSGDGAQYIRPALQKFSRALSVAGRTLGP